jgi:hypothetical protein
MAQSAPRMIKSAPIMIFRDIPRREEGGADETTDNGVLKII